MNTRLEADESVVARRFCDIEDELATLTAHLNAATARVLELVAEASRAGELADELVAWLAFRCGISAREARAYVRVAEALVELPAIRAAFARGELTLTKVRALTRVATPGSEERLLELAGLLTASQLERALRAFRRLRAEEARDAHELEYVAYQWGEDGSLYLRARLPAEDGTVVVRALDAARERIRERRREETSGEAIDLDEDFEPPRQPAVEALVEVAHAALGSSLAARERSHVVVHVDALALATNGPGRSELEDGPALAPETARRLGCDAETVAMLEHDGVLASVGRRRRTVPPKLRRLLEARDDRRCRWPGCERTRHLDAHHLEHWARGGETSVDNLVLLCSQHHRLVHEGGYAIEGDPGGTLRFRNRHGVLCPCVPRSPPASVLGLVSAHERSGLRLDPATNRNGTGERLDLALAVASVTDALAGASAEQALAA